MEIKLIATDMDGTLLDSEKRMPKDLKRVVRALKEKGISFIAASGRQYHSLRRDFESMIGDMAFIAENGAMIVENDRKLFIDPLPGEIIPDILRATQAYPDIYPVVCCADGALVEKSASEEFIRSMQHYYADTQVVDSLLGCCDRLEEVCKVAFFDETQAKTRALPVLQRALSDRLEVIFSSDQWVDVMKPGVNKGRAMQMLMEIKGVKPQECMAFGDYLNDLALLRSVGESYAMANAVDEIKAAAKYIAPSNDEDGVMRVIRERFDL